MVQDKVTAPPPEHVTAAEHPKQIVYEARPVAGVVYPCNLCKDHRYLHRKLRKCRPHAVSMAQTLQWAILEMILSQIDRNAWKQLSITPSRA